MYSQEIFYVDDQSTGAESHRPELNYNLAESRDETECDDFNN